MVTLEQLRQYDWRIVDDGISVVEGWPKGTSWTYGDFFSIRCVGLGEDSHEVWYIADIEDHGRDKLIGKTDDVLTAMVMCVEHGGVS